MWSLENAAAKEEAQVVRENLLLPSAALKTARKKQWRRMVLKHYGHFRHNFRPDPGFKTSKILSQLWKLYRIGILNALLVF